MTTAENLTDSQAESILSNENDVLVISYFDEDRKIVFQDYPHNDKILTHIHNNYDLMLGSDDPYVCYSQMWVRKGRNNQ